MIVVDLNPFTRSSKKATITIVDNIIRAIPLLIKQIRQLKKSNKNKLKKILKNHKNKKNLKKAIKEINNNLVKS